jgi:hypothetical protein
MALELPALSAVIARLPNPETHLATYGGVVFPLSLIIEAPIIMLLAASTALSKDWQSYVLIRRFMMIVSGALTLLHFLVAFTPLYDVVVIGFIDPPPEIIEPARLGLRIMLPWTWSIAFRRFNQGVLIRFGHSEVVGLGTVIRLTADGIVLLIGFLIGTIPGIVVATTAVACGVLSEALFAGLRVRPVLREEVKKAPAVDPPLTLRSFLDFYIPLAMTSLLTLLIQPLGSAALSRMPMALSSLAVWPVVSGLIFMLRSLGVAYNEVMVALLDEPASFLPLRRFALLLGAGTTLALLAMVGTPLAEVWFARISSLSPELVTLGRLALWLALPVPALSVVQSFFQGVLLNRNRTRGITESVVIFLLTSGVILWLGVVWGEVTGIYVGWAAFSLGFFFQAIYLWLRSRNPMRELRGTEAFSTPI